MNKIKVVFIKACQTATGTFKRGDAGEVDSDKFQAGVDLGMFVTATEWTAMQEKHEQGKQSIITAISAGKTRGAIEPKDETVQATSLKRFEEGAPVDMVVELINAKQAPKQQQDDALLQARLTKPFGETGKSGVTVTAVGIEDAATGYIKARAPMTNLIRAGKWKEAFDLSIQSSAIHSAHFKPIIKSGGDFRPKDMVRAADVSDPDSQLGTLATGLVLMRNLGFLVNQLGFLPYISTDLRNEPARFLQPIFTRYITPPTVATYIPGVGYTTDSTTINNNSAHETETSGTRTPSVPTTTDKTVTMDQNKAVEIDITLERLGMTMRNLFAEHQGASLCSLANEIASFVLKTAFSSTWKDGAGSTYTGYAKALANFNITSMVGIKNQMTLNKIPNIGRFALLHSCWHDKLLEDGNLVLANTILAALNKDNSAFQTGDMPPLFGIKILESQLASAVTGTITAITDPTSIGSVNQVGFVGNMSSLLFVSRIPQDYMTAIPNIPATAAIEIVTEPESGLSMLVVKFVDHTLGRVTQRCALMYGCGQGHPQTGFVIKPS